MQVNGPEGVQSAIRKSLAMRLACMAIHGRARVPLSILLFRIMILFSFTLAHGTAWCAIIVSCLMLATGSMWLGQFRLALEREFVDLSPKEALESILRNFLH